jgi:hypothetical protein
MVNIKDVNKRSDPILEKMVTRWAISFDTYNG